MKKLKNIILLLLILLSFSSCKNNNVEKLYVIFNEMKDQYGDSILIKYKNFEILVDAGQNEDADEVSKTIKENVKDNILDTLILTHPHADHIGGIASGVLSNSGIKSITTWIDSGALYSTSSFQIVENIKHSFIDKGTLYHAAYDFFNTENLSNRIYLDVDDNVYIDIFDTGEYPLPNSTYQGGNINNVSVTFALNYNNTQFFFGGDISKMIEERLENRIDKQYFSKDKFTVFKANHHGSTGSNSLAMLDIVSPNMVLISSAISDNNRSQNGVVSSQHPYPAVISRFRYYTNEIYWTGTNGTFVCSSDGKTCKVEGKGRTIDYYFNNQLVPSLEEKDKPFIETKWFETGK